jgi:hypothetical protein
MGYAVIDQFIGEWAARHSLVLSTDGDTDQYRTVWVSSDAGECFQIWIDPPVDGTVRIWADCVEGRREGHPPEDWNASVGTFPAAIEEAFQAVIAWMRPSKRHFPNAAPDRHS